MNYHIKQIIWRLLKLQIHLKILQENNGKTVNGLWEIKCDLICEKHWYPYLRCTTSNAAEGRGNPLPSYLGGPEMEEPTGYSPRGRQESDLTEWLTLEPEANTTGTRGEQLLLFMNAWNYSPWAKVHGVTKDRSQQLRRHTLARMSPLYFVSLVHYAWGLATIPLYPSQL